MQRILEIVKIGYTTQYTDLPTWAATAVNIGGAGFTVAGEQFAWYDYVARIEYEGIRGIKSAIVDNIMANAEAITRMRNTQ